MVKSGLAFHVHHDKLIEFCTDYDDRVRYIKANKPADEVDLRLRLFQLIPAERLPGRESAEWAAYVEAWAAYVKARAAYDEAREGAKVAARVALPQLPVGWQDHLPGGLGQNPEKRRLT